MHWAVWSSAAPQSWSAAALSEGNRTLSVDDFVSDLDIGCSERCCITAFSELITAMMAVLTVAFCLLHSAAVEL